MQSVVSLSDGDLLARMPKLVLGERRASAEVVAHLVEIDRRRLYLGEACSSLFSYCCERLGYSEDEALKRVRVARLACDVPQVLDELRSGAIHLTGLFVLSRYVNAENAERLLVEARGKSRRELERLLAVYFPQPDVVERITEMIPGGAGERTCPGTGNRAESVLGSESGSESESESESGSGSGSLSALYRASRLEPLSASRFRVEFTASRELCDKIERARNLLSHSLPSGDLAALFERSLDELLACEMKRRMGANRPRKGRALKVGSRHVPVEVVRAAWERDGARCAFVDAQGRRCNERRFLTLEHRVPLALGGLSTLENVCLLCASHNAHTAREAFGSAHIEQRRAERVVKADDTLTRALSALCHLGFGRAQATRAISELSQTNRELDASGLVRAAVARLTPEVVRR